MDDQPTEPALQPLGRQLKTRAVGLQEAALDSPSFRATANHFADQVEIIEKWLEGYVRAITRLTHDVTALEDTFSTFLQKSIPPPDVGEAVLDHDYTLLAMRRFGEGSRELWSQIFYGMKKMDSNIVDPIKAFLAGELRNFRDARRYLDQAQKTFDTTLARYVAQSKTKEPSSLREDAFQVHEHRRTYQKAALDFCLLVPELRHAIDKLLVNVCADQWRDMRKSREFGGTNFTKWGLDMDRVRGWNKEMEASEGAFRRELQYARRDFGEQLAKSMKPSRELEDYSVSTVPFLGGKGPSTMSLQTQGKNSEVSEKQGWLFHRQFPGKTQRAGYYRRWFYVKNGIFGWLQQGERSGGVEESDKYGVLLCNVKPAVHEDRRFCFEVKTKQSAMLLQAETQAQLMEWLSVFEIAKTRALSASATNDYSQPGGIDPAFAITPPSIPEFAARALDGNASEDLSSSNLQLPGMDSTHAHKGSFDAPKRAATTREEIFNKLDNIHRKTTLNPEPPASSLSQQSSIANLIAQSHNILPVYTPPPAQNSISKQPTILGSSLAPGTLANPPAPTNLSKSAVIVSGERGIGIGRGDDTGGMPSGILANLWGTSNWGYINRLEKVDDKSISPGRSIPPSPAITPQENIVNSGDENHKPTSRAIDNAQAGVTGTDSAATSLGMTHKKAASVDILAAPILPKPEQFPPNWPVELKAQQAQFRMLFPNVPLEDKVLLVFRATWNPSDDYDFPGRVYVTQNDIYFYSHYFGLVLITGVGLDSITEVTAAPGKDCDFIFLHLPEGVSTTGYSRVTIKLFLENLRLLQLRLNYLIDIIQADEPPALDAIIATLIKMEHEKPSRSPSLESWEDIPGNTPIDNGTEFGRAKRQDLRQMLHVERGTGRMGNEVAKFQLPSKPVIYEPPDMEHKVVERQFQISSKALFHVMFGDKSAVFQLLYYERRNKYIAQGPWVAQEESRMRRDFEFQVESTDYLKRSKQVTVVDYQVIEIMNDHVCYVVSDFKTPWHLPYHKDFMLISKIVITHIAKSKCKLAIFTKVDWSRVPRLSKGLVERQALDDSKQDGEELAEVVADQVRRLGKNSRTQKAIHIFGQIGQTTDVSLFSAKETSNSKKPQIKQRTLTHMVMEITSSWGESMITSVMMWTFALIKRIWKIVNANSIILIALLLSVMVNFFFTSRDTSVWWAERNAAKFMARIGVGPNPIMSKAIYLKDLDETLRAVPTDLSGATGSQCYDQFREIANVTDFDSPYLMASSSYSERATRSTAKRLRRTRQHLGTYRHDLVVAMRVVNNIEQEMLKAEWENWLLDENSRCKQVEVMLRSAPKPSGKSSKLGKAQKVLQEEEKGAMEELRKWQQDYCGSCQREQQRLSVERKHLTFG